MSEPIAADGDGSTSSARLSSVTVVERGALGVREQPPACEAREDVDGTVPPQAPTAAGQENEERTEGSAADAGGLVLRQPIARASVPRDEDEDESIEGNSPADGASLVACSSPKAHEVAVEGLSTDAARPSFPTLTEHETSMSGRRPPTRKAQEGASSGCLVQPAPTVEEKTATCSDSAMADDGHAGSAARSSSGDSTMSSARLSSLFPPGHEASGVRGQSPVHEAQEDANREDQVQVTVEQENAGCPNSAAMGDRPAESGHRSSSGDSTMSPARLSSLIPAGHEASIAGGRPPTHQAQEDMNAPAQAQATPAGEQKDSEGSAVSFIASAVNHVANELPRRSEPGVVDLRAAPVCTLVPQRGSGRRGKSFTRVLNAVGMNIYRTARQIGNGAKKCWAKLRTFGTKVA